MIFIYESQLNVDSDCLEKYKSFHSLDEACRIYKFLYSLKIELIERLSEIHFFYLSGKDITYYKEIFSKFAPEIETYNKQIDINLLFQENRNIFPSVSEIQDPRKLVLIKNLIRKTHFVEIPEHKEHFLRNYYNSDLLINLLLTGNVSQDIIANHIDKKKIKSFSSYERMNIKEQEGPAEIEIEQLLDIVEKLKLLNHERFLSIPEELTAEIYRFKPTRLMSIFNDSLFSKLDEIRNKKLTRLQIIGKDNFLSNRVVDELLKGYRYIFYDLLEGIPVIAKKNMSWVFFNFDLINDSIKYFELNENVNSITRSFYIIMQSSKKIIINYFKDYMDIKLPEKENINRVISDIILTLLEENRVIASDFYLAYMIVQKNSFSKLISDIDRIEDLDFILKQIQRIPINELWENPYLWYYIVTELKNRKLNKLQDNTCPIICNFVKNKWSIYGLKQNSSFDLPDSLGIRYMLLLIYFYHEHNYKDRINASVLRLLANNFEKISDDVSFKGVDDSTDAKSIKYCIENIDPKNPENDPVQRFCNDSIKDSINYFWYVQTSLDKFEIIDSRFSKELYDKMVNLTDKFENEFEPKHKSKSHPKSSRPKVYSEPKIQRNLLDS